MTIKYTPDHEWINYEGDAPQANATVTVGITHHAQDALGDVVFVDLPSVGTILHAKEIAGVVESVKAAADVHMPASATVLQVNEELRADPSLANTDPEGKGWFCKVQLSDLAELDGLMDASTYAGFAG